MLLLEGLRLILFGYPRVVDDDRERCWCLIGPLSRRIEAMNYRKDLSG